LRVFYFNFLNFGDLKMNRATFIILAAIILGAAGFLIASRMFVGGPLNDEFPEFYRAGFLRRTPELEKAQTIQGSLQKMKSAGICGLNYRNRVSQTNTDPVMAQSCASGEWLRISKAISPMTVSQFAILSRESGLIVVTPAEKGSNTLEEYSLAIPQMVDSLVLAWPEIVRSEQTRQSEAAAAESSQRQKQKEVEESFK
jgi:hypothetical protein